MLNAPTWRLNSHKSYYLLDMSYEKWFYYIIYDLLKSPTVYVRNKCCKRRIETEVERA